jgi:hypothetical protein
MDRCSLAIVFVVALSTSCLGAITADVTRIGPERPRRPFGCQVEVFSEGAPYPTEDVGMARVECPGDRNPCIAELRNDACGYGGDTVYGFVEGFQDNRAFLSATLAIKRVEAAALPVSRPPAAALPVVPSPLAREFPVLPEDLPTADCGGATRDVRRIGAARPRKPLGCKVEVFLGRPSYPTEDVGTAYLTCPCDPTSCIPALRDDACGYGGDTVYGFVRGFAGDPAIIRATLAIKTAEPPPR